MGHNASFSGMPKVDLQMLGWFWDKMLEKALPKIILALGAMALAIECAPTALGWPRQKRGLFAKNARWLGMIAISLALTMLMLRPGADGRYGNFTAMLLSIVALAAVARVAFQAAGARGRALRVWGAPVLAALGLLINSPIDELVKIPKNYWFNPATLHLEQFFPKFAMQQWVREHLSPNDKILFIGEKQQFYLDRPFETVVEMKKWERLLTPARTAGELFAVVRAQGYRYVHFSPETGGGYPGILHPYWSQIMALSDRAVYRSPTSLIFDLSVLR